MSPQQKRVLLMNTSFEFDGAESDARRDLAAGLLMVPVIVIVTWQGPGEPAQNDEDSHPRPRRRAYTVVPSMILQRPRSSNTLNSIVPFLRRNVRTRGRTRKSSLSTKLPRSVIAPETVQRPEAGPGGPNLRPPEQSMTTRPRKASPLRSPPVSVAAALKPACAARTRESPATIVEIRLFIPSPLARCRIRGSTQSVSGPFQSSNSC